MGQLLVPIWHTMAVAKIFHLVGECAFVCVYMHARREGMGKGRGGRRERGKREEGKEGGEEVCGKRVVRCFKRG